jgi:hypothetical protein
MHYSRMGKSESSSYSPKGYTKNDMAKIKNLIDEEHASEGDCISIDGAEEHCTAKKKERQIRKDEATNERKKRRKSPRKLKRKTRR